jgi:hypothetical protein
MPPFTFAVTSLAAALAFLCATGCSKSSTPVAGGDAATRVEPLELGRAKLLDKDVRHPIAGTNWTVTIRRAAMGSVLVDGDPNKETHVLSVTLELENDGTSRRIELTEGKPETFDGLRFQVSSLGFEFGRSAASVLVQRAP